MDPITRQAVVAAAAGAAGGEALYVDDVFSTYLYEGTGSTQSIDNGIDLSGEGGLVWLKKRSASAGHYWADTVRGETKTIRSDGTSGEATNAVPINSFNSNGFTIGGDSEINSILGHTMASWTFRKAPGFFDVVTYTGDGVSGRTVSHSLGSTPGMIIIKSTSNVENWQVWHRSVTGNLELDNTGAANSSSVRVTAVSSTDFTLSTFNTSNANGQTYVAYIFAHDDQSFGTNGDESIIKCGSYTGTGSDPVITVGWEPQWLLIKSASTTGNWQLYDVMRGMPVGGDESRLYADLTNAEESIDNAIELTSTGFIPRSSATDVSGVDYIYMAIRRPHKPPTAATEVLYLNARTGTGADLTTTGIGFPHDAVVIANRSNAGDWKGWFDRLRGNFTYLLSHETNAEGVAGGYAFNDATGTAFLASNNRWNRLSQTHIDYFFRRAPGFMDVVAYTSDGSVDQQVSHNLGVIPELIINKERSGNGSWTTYHSALGRNVYVYLNSPNVSSSFTNIWGTVDPTSSTFNIRSASVGMGSGDTAIAYLFASLDGISKVGTYSGTGSNVDVDCGFTAGARFVLIKRTDSSGDWYVWDTTRGIISGNDPYIFLNDTAAEVTTTDYIDPLNAGFTVTSSAPAALNASGGSYIYLSVA